MDTKLKKRNPVLVFFIYFCALSVFISSVLLAILAISQGGVDHVALDYKQTKYYQQRAIGSLIMNSDKLITINSDANRLAMEDIAENNANIAFYIEDSHGSIYRNNTDARSVSEFTRKIEQEMEHNRAENSGFIFNTTLTGYEHLLTLKNGMLTEIMNLNSIKADRIEKSWPLAKSPYALAYDSEGNEHNFRTDPGNNGAVICLAVKADGLLSNYGSIYESYYMWYREMSIVLSCAAAAVFSVIILILLLFKHQSFSTAKEWLARITGWFWLEPKLISFGIVLYLGMFSIYSMFHENRIDVLFLLLFCLWASWLVINDIRYNKKLFFTHNIPSSVKKFLRSLECEQEFLAKMKKRLIIYVVTEILLIITCAVTAFTIVIPLIVIVIGIILLVDYVKRYNKSIDDFARIIEYTQAIRTGNAIEYLNFTPDSDFKEVADNLSDIHSGMSHMVEDRIKSEQMKVELITNVSHDLKTPLTSIINYVDLLSREKLSPDFANDYVKVLAKKSERLKNLVQDLFEISKANSGAIDLNLEQLDVASLLEQTVAELDSNVKQAGVEIKLQFGAPQVTIRADGKKIHRVFENLLGNALKYSLANTRIYVTVAIIGTNAQIVFKNVANYEMQFSAEEIVERFSRGDSSRTMEGSGLGLAIAKSFLELNDGLLRIEKDGDLFKAIVEIPLYIPYEKRVTEDGEYTAPVVDTSEKERVATLNETFAEKNFSQNTEEILKQEQTNETSEPTKAVEVTDEILELEELSEISK